MTRYVYGRVRAAVDEVDLGGLAPTMRSFMRANIASSALVFVDPAEPLRTSRPGCVIASPSFTGVTDQNYVHHWVRDAAITAMELAAAPDVDADGVDRTLGDYVAFSQVCQDNAPAGHFFRAAFHIDGTARDWSDQKDGPSLQSTAFVAAWPHLDATARATARTVAQRNLDETVAAWPNDAGTLGPWEDVQGPSFFARAAQIHFLDEVLTTNPLGLAVSAGVEPALEGLREVLGNHWSDDKGCYISIPGGTPGSPDTDVSGYDPNADVIMGFAYGSVACTDPKLLATAAGLRAAFDVGGPREYPINVDDRARGLGPLIGRYPSDTYDGDIAERPNEGHPWAICTANVAQLYYTLATAFRNGDGPPFDDLTSAFFTQVALDAGTVNDPARADTVATALVGAGDAMLKAILFHSDHLHLSEQFDKVTGFEKSVQDLTWSYAAYLSAVRARP